MKPHNRLPLRILRTTALRLAVRYLLLYLVLLVTAVFLLRWSANWAIDKQVSKDLKRELARLLQACPSGEPDCLSLMLKQEEESEDKDEEDKDNKDKDKDEDEVLEKANQGFVFLVLSPTGKHLAGDMLDWLGNEAPPVDGEVHTKWFDEEILPRERFDDDAYVPIVAHKYGNGNHLILGRIVEQAGELQEIADYLLEGLGIAVLLALAIGMSVGQSVLKRMDQVSQTASEIVAGDLSRRIPISGRRDEFDILGEQLNKMLDRIEHLLQQMREVTDNIAHDLRSPLTRLRSHLEITLLEKRSDEEYREVLRQGIADVDSLIKTFQALLGIAQVEAGNHRTGWGIVRLDVLVEDLLDLYKPVAEECAQKLSFEGQGKTEVIGSRELLAEAISNLLENAIKYTPHNGLICVKLSSVSEVVQLTVSDTGNGIPQSEKEHVFERFVRLESARNTPGNGLGLSLVKAVANLHHAKVFLEDGHPGLIVRLTFPPHDALEISEHESRKLIET